MIFTVNSTQDLSLDMILDTKRQLREENAQMEVEEREKLLAFYNNLQGSDEYLTAYGFEDAELPPHTLNLTKKVIDKISLVYKYAPDRAFEGEEDSSYTAWIRENPKFNVWQKESERKKNLLGMVLKRPVYLPDKGWRFFTETQWEPHFLVGDPFTPVAYSIPIKHDVTDTKSDEEDWLMFWSDKYYFWYQKDSEKQFYDPAFPDGEHKLDMLPIVESRTNFPTENYWVSGAVDLMQANQAININLNNLNVAIHNQAFDQPYAKGISATDAEKNPIRIGSNKVIYLSDENMDLSLLGFNPKIMDMIESIKFEAQSIASAYNIDMEFGLSGDPASGFSLLVRNIDLMEARENSVEFAEMEEQEVYKIIQRQQEVYKIKEPRLPKDKPLIVDFHEISFPINQAEEIERLEFEYKWNISTPVDTIQSKEGLEQDEAEQRFADNKALNAKLSPVQEAFQNELTNAIGEENEPEGTE